jgi:hypothetical protein
VNIPVPAIDGSDRRNVLATGSEPVLNK